MPVCVCRAILDQGRVAPNPQHDELGKTSHPSYNRARIRKGPGTRLLSGHEMDKYYVYGTDRRQELECDSNNKGPHRMSTVVTRDRHEMPRSIPLVELWPARDAVEDSTVVGGRIPLLTTFPVKRKKRHAHTSKHISFTWLLARHKSNGSLICIIAWAPL